MSSGGVYKGSQTSGDVGRFMKVWTIAASTRGVSRGHVRREQGMSSAFAVSIEGLDSCFESHHLLCIMSHGQPSQ